MSNCSDGSCSTGQGGDVSQEDYQKVAQQNQELKTLLKQVADDRNSIIRKNKADYSFGFFLGTLPFIGLILWVFLR